MVCGVVNDCVGDTVFRGDCWTFVWEVKYKGLEKGLKLEIKNELNRGIALAV